MEEGISVCLWIRPRGGFTRRGAMVAAAEEDLILVLVEMGFQTAVAAVGGVGGVGGVGKGTIINNEEGLFMDSLRLVMLVVVVVVVLLLMLALQDFNQGFKARPAGHKSRQVVRRCLKCGRRTGWN